MKQVLAVILVLGSTAYADENAVKTLVAAQVAAINAHDAKAFAATMDADDGIAILPEAADEGMGRAAIEAAAKRWLTSLGTATVKLEQPHYGNQWFDAELVLSTGARLRVTGVAVTQQTDLEKETYKLGAVHISEGVDDKTVLASIDKLPALPTLAADDKPDRDTPDQVASFADRMYALETIHGKVDNDADIVIGSAPTERAVGGKAAGKLLAGWKSLKLAPLTVSRHRDPRVMLIEWYVAHVDATIAVKGKPTKVPYRVLTIVMQPWAAAAERGAKSQLVSAHFSIAMR
jgi:hypothetical protein